MTLFLVELEYQLDFLGKIIKLSKSPKDCCDVNSIFEVQPNGQIIHTKSGLCIVKDASKRKTLKLTSCNNGIKLTPYDGENVLRIGIKDADPLLC